MNNNPTPTSPKRMSEYEKERIQSTKFFSIFIISLLVGLISGFFGFIIGYRFIYPMPEDGSSQVTVVRSQPDSDEVINIKKATEQIQPSQMNLIYSDSKKYAGQAIVITADGWLITPTELVPDYKKIKAHDFEGNSYSIKNKIDDEYSGLSFLKISTENLRPVVLLDSENIKLGEKGMFYNEADPKNIRLQKNYISQIRRYRETASAADSYPYDFLLAQTVGDELKGFPFINYKGEVIGIFTGGDKVLPNQAFTKIMDRVFSEQELLRPGLDITYKNISQQPEPVAEQNRGVLVINSENELIKPNDILLYINNVPLDENQEFVDLLLDYSVGDEVEILLLRDGNQENIKIKL